MNKDDRNSAVPHYDQWGKPLRKRKASPLEMETWNKNRQQFSGAPVKGITQVGSEAVNSRGGISKGNFAIDSDQAAGNGSMFQHGQHHSGGQSMPGASLALTADDFYKAKQPGAITNLDDLEQSQFLRSQNIPNIYGANARVAGAREDLANQLGFAQLPGGGAIPQIGQGGEFSLSDASGLPSLPSVSLDGVPGGGAIPQIGQAPDMTSFLLNQARARAGAFTDPLAGTHSWDSPTGHAPQGDPVLEQARMAEILSHPINPIGSNPYGTGSVGHGEHKINGQNAGDFFQNYANHFGAEGGPNAFARPEPGYHGVPWGHQIPQVQGVAPGSAGAILEAQDRDRDRRGGGSILQEQDMDRDRREGGIYGRPELIPLYPIRKPKKVIT